MQSFLLMNWKAPLNKLHEARQSDLRSVDFRKARLEGASINAAKISGAYFPAELTASEIEISLLHGTRMRYRSEK